MFIPLTLSSVKLRPLTKPVDLKTVLLADIFQMVISQEIMGKLIYSLQ